MDGEKKKKTKKVGGKKKNQDVREGSAWAALQQLQREKESERESEREGKEGKRRRLQDFAARGNLFFFF